MEYGYVKCMDKLYQRKDSIWTSARKGKGSIRSCPGFWASFRSSISSFLTFFFSSHKTWRIAIKCDTEAGQKMLLEYFLSGATSYRIHVQPPHYSSKPTS